MKSLASNNQRAWFALCLGISLLLAVCAGTYLAFRAYDRRRSNVVLAEIRFLDGTTDQWCIENGKTCSDAPTWNDVKQFFKTDSRLFRSGGKDILGNPYILGPDDDCPSIHPHTVARLAWALDPDIPEKRRYNFGQTQTPDIVLAARLGDAALFQELLQKGADVRQPDAEGKTALYWAARMGYPEIVLLLWPLLPDPLSAINQGWPRAPHLTPFYAACDGNAAVLAFFLDQGAKPDPYQLRAAARRPDVLKTLLAHGLSPDATDEAGASLLFAALHNADSVRLLIAAGADVNVYDRGGETVLQAASRYGCSGTPALLKGAGARE